MWEAEVVVSLHRLVLLDHECHKDRKGLFISVTQI